MDPELAKLQQLLAAAAQASAPQQSAQQATQPPPTSGSPDPQVAGGGQQPPEEAPPEEKPYEAVISRERIFDMLNKRQKDDGEEVLDVEMTDIDAKVKVSDTVLKLDKWSISYGQTLANNAYNDQYDLAEEIGMTQGFNSQECKDAMPSRDNPLYDPLVRADMFSACFEYAPEFAERPHDLFRAQWMKSMMESPDFQALRASCTFDDELAAIASNSLTQSYVAVASEAGSPGGGGGSGGGQGAGNSSSIDYKRMASAANQAIRQAQKQVQEANDMMKSVGNAMLRDDVAVLFRKVKHNQQLKEIMDKAGRYLKLARSKQDQRTKEAHDDVDGIEFGGDLDKLIPIELSMIADEDLGDETLRRYVERSCMQTSFFGYRPKSSGPIVIVVDESGSMSGDRIANAKAFALAMAWIAKQQKRWCAFISFSHHSEGRICVLHPDKWDSEAMVEWMSEFDGGGTTPTVALETVPFKYWDQIGAPKGKTDMITITDGGMGVDSAMIKRFNEWKEKEKVHHYLMCIDDAPGQFGEACDTIWQIKSLSVEEKCIADLMSI